MPVAAHCCLYRLLPEGFRGGRRGEGDHGVREGVEEGDLPDLAEPRVLEAVVEDVEAVAVEDVAGAELGNHQEQAELSHVQHTSSGDGFGQEVDSRHSVTVQAIVPF